MIVIVDYGLGNLGAVNNMFGRIGASSEITSDPAVIERAAALVLPGVGAFDQGMSNLDASGLTPVVNEVALVRKIPVLGICLGWFPADVRKFTVTDNSSLRIPHMGWNTVRPTRASDLLAETEPRFYFAHSYFVTCDVSDLVLATTTYGSPFCSVLQSSNIVATQFHPEKSHRFGMALLRAFVNRVRA
jgi:imidazole glycerol-phosphate synthase subunit HisH